VDSQAIGEERNSLAALIRRLVDVPCTDPDDARRRKLLNVLLVSTLPLTLVSLAVTAFATAVQLEGLLHPIRLFLAELAVLLVLGITYSINRFGSGTRSSCCA
jgi:hypothetical protein